MIVPGGHHAANIATWVRRWTLWLILFYKRWVSPFLPPHCRFYPSCSEYAADAIRLHGLWRGFWLALKRVGRCHPFCEGGCDPVPQPRDAQSRHSV